MSEEKERKLISKSGTITDLVLAVLFFLFMRWVLKSHVPSNDPEIIGWIASFTSLCLTFVFWLAASMLRVTWVDWARKKAGE
ncbi:uncharacterized protein METZ01_LOCUS238092 [marine metagenome]|uniref:Uncharacterized protein n=1 Tax=marine metagenome TaxID=408172 RepID=A0A382HD44_9ZZZZ